MVTSIEKLIEKIAQEEIDEVNAVSAGGVSGTGGTPLGKDMSDQHEIMWAGDEELQEDVIHSNENGYIKGYKRLDGYWWIEELVVNPESRGTGIAKELMKHIPKKAMMLPGPMRGKGSEISKDKLISFYKKFGFKEKEDEYGNLILFRESNSKQIDYKTERDKNLIKVRLTQNNEQIGTLRLIYDGAKAYIDGVLLDTGQRNRGLGKDLYRKADEISREYFDVPVSSSDFRTPSANKVWKSLVASGEAKYIKDEDRYVMSRDIDEFNALSTGAVVGYTLPLGAKSPYSKKKKKTGQKKWYDVNPKNIGKRFVDEQKLDNDKKNYTSEEYIGKKGGLGYYQIGGSLPDELYNKTDDGKPTRDPGVAGINRNKRKKKRTRNKEHKKPSLGSVFLEQFDKSIVLYHGTCKQNAENMIKNGWQPRSGHAGAHQGQTKYLYLTTAPENAQWYANERGCNTVLQVATPLSNLVVDPEDGIGETVEEELQFSKRTGLPANLALFKSINSDAFSLYKPNIYNETNLDSEQKNGKSLKEFAAIATAAIQAVTVDSERFESGDDPFKPTDVANVTHERFIEQLPVTKARSIVDRKHLYDVFVTDMDPQFKRTMAMAKNSQKDIPDVKPEPKMKPKGDHRIKDLGYSKVAEQDDALTSDIYLYPYDPNWLRSMQIAQMVTDHAKNLRKNPNKYGSQTPVYDGKYDEYLRKKFKGSKPYDALDESTNKRPVFSLKETFLKEKSFEEKDIPKVFWLVTSIADYNEDFVKQIADGVLQDVKGISGNKQIILDFFQVARNAALIMPGKETVELNDLSRVMYDNPHYLLSNNMNALYRIWGRDPDDDYAKVGMIQNLFDYIKKTAKQMNLSEDMSSVLYAVDYGTLSSSSIGRAFKEEGKKINSIKDLAGWIKQSLVNLAEKKGTTYVENAKNTSEDEWANIIWNALEEVGKIYKSEGEWIVKDKELKIPKNTILYIALPGDIDKVDPDIKQKYLAGEKISHFVLDQSDREALNTIQLIEKYRLDKKYKINFVNAKKFDNIRRDLLKKRSNEK